MFFLCITDGCMVFFFFSSRRRHTRLQGDWSSDVCSSDLRRLLNASSRNGFEQWARHAENLDAEIANREWIEPGALEPDILTRADLHGARFRQIVLKSRKQGLQGLQPAREQHMGMLGLRRAASGRGLGGKHVPLDDRDFPEMPRDRLSGRKAGHAGANNHRMTSAKIWHVFLLERSMSNKIEGDQRTRTADAAASGIQAYLIFFGAMVNGITSLSSKPITKRSAQPGCKQRLDCTG